jgi:hypothetical protein
MTNFPAENQARIGFSEIHLRPGGTIAINQITSPWKDHKSRRKVNHEAAQTFPNETPELLRRKQQNPPLVKEGAGRRKVFHFGFLLLILRMQIKKTMRLLQFRQAKKTAPHAPSRKRFERATPEERHG